ncbi:hypothetical protein Oweho_2397 [Owenweeksia hongkongensis DSM 17368]|uniref:Lipocalin-like domain-containing protein n=1 Tax=Owenweeksia hongkongensis (strain DSM 17368 / CIP 108786 / JCM 12287 / NRRL B-23963 / UST20020801) TaxID=926562 RepID=G8R702_OWEHD|nr:hypothetical protein [Owenweeksia hongkongensis]AEV33367.1 hypothetical protein Oweho_2397 [Owenweeksia hongkongensis DSM 17368]
MMKGRIIWMLALIAGLATACSKDSSDLASGSGYQDEYRFYAKAKINGLPIDFNAGENGYGLETDYTLEDSVIIMTGKLAKENQPLKNTILLNIRGNKKVADESSFRVEQSLYPGLFSYRDLSGYITVAGSYDLKFLGDTSYSQLGYNWTFENGGNSSLRSPAPIRVSVSEFDPFKVTLKTDYYGCISEVTHWVNIQNNCDATIKISEISNYGFKVKAISRQGNVLNVDWALDGQEVDPDFVGAISSSLYGTHTLRAEIYFEEGCSKVVERTFDAFNTTPCLTDFWYEKNKSTTYDSEQLGAVELEYYDENGKKFTTFYSGTNGDFEIVSLSPYLENEKGQQTTRFFFEANAILKSEDGTSVELTECFGSFAVAHP